MLFKIKRMRPAIAMIELIFAIVIMGIVLMSAPRLISTAAKSGYVAIQQENINEAATRINMIMGYHWDENNVDDRFLAPILGFTTVNTDLSEFGTTGRRLGTPQTSYRSFIRSDGTDDLNASTTLGSDGSGEVEDDMDDFIGDTNLTQIELSNIDYIETVSINIATNIAYNADSVTGGYNQSDIVFNPFIAAGGTTNIKSITTTLTTTSSFEELDKEIVLRAFTCNIGEYRLEERNF